LRRLRLSICLLLIIILPCQAGAAAAPEAVKRLEASLKTLTQIMASPRTVIPSALLQKASAVVIIPNMVKASFLLGARYGRGVLMVREEDGRWGNPVFIILGGGSFGLQLGLQSTDLVLVSRRGTMLDKRTRRNVMLGADASIMVGVIGIQMDENTSTDLGTEIYSFSQTTGLTAGFSLQGTHLRLDDVSTAALYGKSSVRAKDVLAGKVDTVSNEVLRFRERFVRIAGSTS
jgi:lipid-binding SYLF domain-containing protein